jgi:6,7-dimethyl-8-ribityllumazine synthase
MATQQDTHLLYTTDNLQVYTSQVVLICTEWNDKIIHELVEGAQRILSQYPEVTVSVYKVPGCVEIPFAIRQHALLKGADAYIAFGCVIRGETPHFDYVCQSVTHGISELNIQLNSPVIFGVLTVNNEEQALDRIGGKHGHKGEEAAMAALKMISIQKQFSNIK